MEKEKDEIKLKGRNKGKTLKESTITFLNSYLQKNGHARQVNENKGSNSILHTYKNPGRSLCKGPPGRTRSPGIAYEYITEHPPDSGKKLNTTFYSKLLLKNNTLNFNFLHFINT